MKNKFAILLLLSTLTFVRANAQTNLINFDDGTLGQPIGNFYLASHGVIFSNVLWRSDSDILGQPFAGCSGAFTIQGQSSGSFPSSSSSLVAIFVNTVTNVSIVASDVGVAGAEIAAYDQEAGGNLVASSEYVNSGIGLQQFATLLVSAPVIKRIELFQPLCDGADGIVWDNLAYNTAPPQPSSLSIDASGTIWIYGTPGYTNRIDYISELDSTNWTTLTNLSLSRSPFGVIDSQFGKLPQRFYRGVSLP